MIMLDEEIVEFHLKKQSSFFEYLTLNDSSGSYLLSGNKGIGKKDFALYLSKAILCDTSKVLKGIHPDFYFLDTDKDKITVEDVEAIESWLDSPPFESDKKVIIIPSSQRLSIIAQNKLLKILEEPPPYLFFFLLVSNTSMLLPTVRSRCIDINFDFLPDNLVLNYLEKDFDDKNLLDLAVFLSNGAIEKNYFCNEENLKNLIDLVAIIAKKEVWKTDILLDKIDNIVKSKIDSKVLTSSIIRVLTYFLKNKCLSNNTHLEVENSFSTISNIRLVELISRLDSFNTTLNSSNFNFRMGIEEIILDFILGNKSKEDLIS